MDYDVPIHKIVSQGYEAVDARSGAPYVAYNYLGRWSRRCCPKVVGPN